VRLIRKHVRGQYLFFGLVLAWLGDPSGFLLGLLAACALAPVLAVAILRVVFPGLTKLLMAQHDRDDAARAKVTTPKAKR
jgi:hypothetical protein